MTITNVFFALLVGAGAAQVPYTSPELGFTMVVPAGFLGEGEDLLNPRAIACFVEASATEASEVTETTEATEATEATEHRTWTRLCVERRGGAIPKRARQMTFAWKGLDLPGASFDSRWADQDVTVFATLVPLRKEAVWLVAMAPLANRAKAQAALVATLATLEGETAAPSRAERAERAERLGSQVGFVAGIIMAIGAGMWIQQRRQQQRG
jgi:hypothetical protein